MALNIKNPEVDELARELARIKHATVEGEERINPHGAPPIPAWPKRSN